MGGEEESECTGVVIRSRTRVRRPYDLVPKVKVDVYNQVGPGRRGGESRVRARARLYVVYDC